MLIELLFTWLSKLLSEKIIFFIYDVHFAPPLESDTQGSSATCPSLQI
jgi:hypothetical protein